MVAILARSRDYAYDISSKGASAAGAHEALDLHGCRLLLASCLVFNFLLQNSRIDEQIRSLTLRVPGYLGTLIRLLLVAPFSRYCGVFFILGFSWHIYITSY